MTTTDILDGRKDRNREQMLALARFCAVTLSVPAICLGLVVGVVLRSPLLGGLLMLLAAGGVAFWMFRTMKSFSPRFIASLQARPADEASEARLYNLTEGLCVAHGLTPPDLYVIDDPALNACTVMTAGGEGQQASLAVTSGLLDSLTRIELEGVVAQQLGHVRDGDTALSTFAAAVGSLPGIGSLLASRVATTLDPDLEAWGDLAAVRMTRYPPGLAAALDKLRTGTTTVGVARAQTAHLWLADPVDGDEPVLPHPPLPDRLAVLREL